MKKSKGTALWQAVLWGKWILLAAVTGLMIGAVGSAFCKGLSFVNGLRAENPWLVYLLPVGGLVIVALYRGAKDEKDGGTNQVITAVQGNGALPLRMAPLIFASTLITHLCGGSAGREGAALQIGGSIGNALGKLFRLEDADKRMMILCGMSAAFAAVFGTPMAAAVFALEMATVGTMQYGALLPCVLSALTAKAVAVYFGIGAESFTIPEMAAFTLQSAVIVGVLAAVCGLISILFCETMHKTAHLYSHLLPNPYLRIMVGGGILIVLTLIVGDQTYNGSGMNIIEGCFEGEVVPYAFLLKLMFTALCLGAGFKGGEIVPAFTVGAASGCLFGVLLGFNPALCSAVGMIAVFCGATNCPLASLLIAFEMFGYAGMPFYLLTVAVSYGVSGYFGLYHTQKIVFSKYKLVEK